MQVTELYELTLWIHDKINATGLATKYQALSQALSQNANRQIQSFEPQKDALLESIKSVNSTKLTYAQEEMLDKMGILNAIDTQGVKSLEDILFRNSLDIATAIQKVSEIIKNLKDAIQSANAIKVNLAKYINDDEVIDTELVDEQVLMRVHFQGEVAFDDVTKFEEFGKKWSEIGRGIALAHSMAPEDIKVVGAAKGSIIIELAAIPAIAITVSKAISGALKIVEQTISIKKALKEMELLGLKIDQVKVQIEKQGNEKEKKLIDDVVKDICKELNISTKNSDGDKIVALEKSVKGIVDFIKKGGELDFYSPESEEESEEIVKLKEKVKEVKLLEKKVLALENKVKQED